MVLLGGSPLTVFDFSLAFGYLGVKQKTTAHGLSTYLAGLCSL